MPYEKNPRTHPQGQIDLLAASMRDDGVTTPILIDEDGVIIYGHGRRLAALQNGFQQYPVAIARGWSEEKKRVVRLKDNSIGLLSGWDATLVTSELQELKLSGYDIELLGFPETQLRGWGVPIGTTSEQDAEAAPEPPKKPVVRLGDLWELGDHRLLCGDATSENDVAMCISKSKPHLMVTDPPYGVEYDPDWRNRAGIGAHNAVGIVTNDDRADWRKAWALFPGDVAYVWHADRHASSVQSSLESIGFEIVCQIIWAKTRLIISRGDYHWQHEPCWYAVKKGKRHNWRGGRSQTTLWQIEHRKSETGHSTQKPIECMKRPIENNSVAGDHIYEPFAGSGTMIIACEMTKRRALAIEIDPGYVQVCIERWENFTGRKATLDGQTLEQVTEARRKGKAKHATGHLGKPLSRGDAETNGGKHSVRKGSNVQLAQARRKPAGITPVVAGDS